MKGLLWALLALFQERTRSFFDHDDTDHLGRQINGECQYGWRRSVRQYGDVEVLKSESISTSKLVRIKMVDVLGHDDPWR